MGPKIQPGLCVHSLHFVGKVFFLCFPSSDEEELLSRILCIPVYAGN